MTNQRCRHTHRVDCPLSEVQGVAMMLAAQDSCAFRIHTPSKTNRLEHAAIVLSLSELLHCVLPVALSCQEQTTLLIP